MRDPVAITPVNLSKPGSPAPSAELLGSKLPAHAHRPTHHELVVHCQTHASGATMASHQVPVRFQYQKAGIQPPVYVAGTFSDVPWQAQEMDAVQQDTGEYTFSKTVTADEGIDIQYKFRIGHQDWWVLDENEHIIDDGTGNLNNTVNTRRFSVDSGAAQASEPVSSRIAALRGANAPDRSITPDFVRTTIEVSDSAALLHDEVPSREVPRHLLTNEHPPRQTHTPIEVVARTAAEVANTAAMLDREHDDHPDHDTQRDAAQQEPPMLAHECVFSDSGNAVDFSSPAEHSTSPRNRKDRWNDEHGIGRDVDLDDPRLERFPSERSAIYAVVRRLSTGVDQDDVNRALLSVARSPDHQSPTDFESSGESNRRLKASDASQSPDRDPGLQSVSSLQSIPEGAEGFKDGGFETMIKTRFRSSSKPQSHDGAGSADDEGISMSIPSSVRGSRYAWEKHHRARSGSITDHDFMDPDNDSGPSALAINHIQSDSPDVMIPRPSLVNDGGDSGIHPRTEITTTKSSDAMDQDTLRKRITAQRPGTPSSVRSSQSVPFPATKSQGGWLYTFFRLIFVDIFGRILNKLFRR